MPIDKAYEENHVSFEIDSIEWEDDANVPGIETEGQGPPSIQFEYSAPAISVDASGRFATHEIIGGSTVRQKIGEEPLEVGISGVCAERRARLIDTLRDAKFGTIYSNRLPGGSLTVHFASSSTSPMEDSGAVALVDEQQEFLYAYDLECVEVSFEAKDPLSDADGGGSVNDGTNQEPSQL